MLVFLNVCCYSMFFNFDLIKPVFFSVVSVYWKLKNSGCCLSGNLQSAFQVWLILQTAHFFVQSNSELLNANKSFSSAALMVIFSVNHPQTKNMLTTLLEHNMKSGTYFCFSQCSKQSVFVSWKYVQATRYRHSIQAWKTLSQTG